MFFINVPKKINIKIGKTWIKFTGPLGSVIKKKSEDLKMYFSKSQNKLYILNNSISKKNHFHFLIINKIIWGLFKGFIIKLQIIGVGFRASVKEDKLHLRLGFSNEIVYEIPKNIKITVLQQKILTLVIFGPNNQLVTQVAAEIRSLKPPEPYKGKGIRLLNEVLKQKIKKKD